MNRTRCLSIFAALLVGMLALPSFSQTPPGNFDPAVIRDRITSRFKTALDCSDDEWKVLEPKVVKVLLLRLDATSAVGMMNRGRFNVSAFLRGVLDPNAMPSQVEEKANDLQQLIDNNETSNSAYTNALAQLRKAREKAKTDLEAAQKDLTGLLTVRQEAALVQLGLLE